MKIKEKIENKWADLKMRAEVKRQQVFGWCDRNKEMIVLMAPIVVAGTVELAKIIMKYSATNDEKLLKERFIYDRTNGHYYETRRQPKPSEWREIDYRRDVLNQPLGDILYDMRLIR